MSVIPMRLVTLAGPLEQFDGVMRACVVDREFQPENALQLMQEIKDLRPMEMNNPYSVPLRKAEGLAETGGVKLEYVPFDGEGDHLEEAMAYLDGLTSRLSELSARQAELQQKVEHNRASAYQLEHIQGMTENLEELRSMRYARFRYGYLPREVYNSFASSINAREDTFFFPTCVEDKNVYAVYFTTRERQGEVDAMFTSLHFVRIRLDTELGGTAEEGLDRLSGDTRKVEAELMGIQRELDEIRVRERETFLRYTSWLRYRWECYELRRYAAQSRETFYLTGWVPEDVLEAFLKNVEAHEELSCVTDSAADVPLTPPTKLKSNFLSRIFRPFLEMYGLPSYDELDPSLFMAITYTLFFGIMFGDLGQGLALAATGLFLWKKKRMWLGGIITCCGCAGAVFGCVYNSVFGFEGVLPWEGFAILEGNHVMLLLIASMVLGVSMLLFVMVLNIANGLRQKNYEKILFGPNGAAGIVFYAGILIAGLATAVGGVNLFVPVYVLPVLVLPLVLMLLKEPLVDLLNGHKDWYKISWGGLLSTGFFELFETMLSYLTNTLSFMRVGAYAITHVGLMMVIQMLAGSNMNPIVIVLGNVFVMGFEGLLVGIQVLRLEFYELFGRFYDDGGVAYGPKVIDYTARST
ncbi:MAG: ATPase V [Oscillospiraceae bacterium]|nr:ATPase V [Oscillospiraceae bacterium]